MDMIKLDDLKAYRDDRIASGNADFDEMDRLSAFIANVETIEPQRGEWLWDNGYFCSECHGEAFSQKFTMLIDEPMYFRSDFCPNCGARMEGADDEID